MLVEYIDGHRDRFGVEPICRVLTDADMQIAPSTYYAAKARPPSVRAVRDAALTEDIRVVHKDNLGVYGARKIHATLNREGVKVARCTVERLMRAAGIQGIRRAVVERDREHHSRPIRNREAPAAKRHARIPCSRFLP